MSTDRKINPKSEFRNPKQCSNVLNPNDRNKKNVLNIQKLKHLDLFRISDFVLRILPAILFIFISHPIIAEDSVKARFNSQGSLAYDVLFNGIAMGNIQWKYLGQELIEDKTAEVVLLNSNTNILQLLSVESKEKVFLDSRTHLPIKAERDVIFFGRQETIEEIYNQEEGYIKIIRRNSTTKEETLKQEKPIHNILSLLYFFPKDLKLAKGKEFLFNLPTQKVNVKVICEKTLSLNKNSKKRVYYMVGSGAKKFNLWLDKRERIPLRLEFIVPVGKITLIKKNNETHPVAAQK
jgi:hypothetical protein